MHSILRRAGAATAVATLAALLTTPAAAAPSTAPAAAADAYALDVDVVLTPLQIAVDEGPFARSTQEYPPQAQEPDEAALLSVGQIPAGGAVVNKAGILTSFAGANSEPLAVAQATAENVELINQGGTPLITATTLNATSVTNCTETPSGEVDIVGLKIGATEIDAANVPPNTVVGDAILNPLGLRAIVNEQHPTADGRGLVVNALHIFNVSNPIIPGLFRGDIIVSHAMSTVNCPNGAPTTGADNDIFIEKTANKAKAERGDTVTYTATFRNNSDQDCSVNQAIDHLPIAFEHVSTSGAFGTNAEVVNRPGGGQDVILKPTGVTIPKGGAVTQTFVAKVRDEAQPGTYFNNVELLCGNLGNWVKGLDAPVEVVTEKDGPLVVVKPPQCSDKKDNDGDGKVDFPNDPGCLSPQDNDEKDQLPRTGGPENLSGFAVLLVVSAYAIRRRMAAC